MGDTVEKLPLLHGEGTCAEDSLRHLAANYHPLPVVIDYPMISPIVMSFQKDAGLDPVTGLFTAGGPAGVQNYVNWIAQQCEGNPPALWFGS